MPKKRRRFGRVRRLPSGRYQARYPDPDGILRPAPMTYASGKEADQWLAQIEADILRGDWTDPDAGNVPFGAYAKAWIEERPGLEESTQRLYAMLLRRHIEPTFGNAMLADISLPAVRRWRKSLLDAGTGETTVAKAYRLFRAIMNTAVDDDLIKGNPCRVKGAGVEEADERPTATIAEVFAIAEAIQPRYRGLVLLAAFTGLRWGELMALRRRHLNLKDGLVTVDASVAQIDAKLVTKAPKSKAGRRTVAIPSLIIADLRWHLRRFAERGPDGRVFIGPKGATPRRSNFNRIWKSSLNKAGVTTDLHFHDLRHTGNTLAAGSGANLRELMTRMGHGSTRAALIYLHATRERDRAIADAMGAMIEEELRRQKEAVNDDSDADEPPTFGAGQPS